MTHVGGYLPPLIEAEGIEYRNIPGYFGYCVGTDGSLWSSYKRGDRGRPTQQMWVKKNPGKSVAGYIQASLKRDDGKRTTALVNVLVLTAFSGPRPAGMECCHRNGMKDDNRLENLYWGTRKQNMEDARRHGTLRRGEQISQAKLDDLKVEAIKVLLAAKWSQREIGILFNVNKSTISAVNTGRSWRNQGDSR